jgi:hypothetical protein
MNDFKNTSYFNECLNATESFGEMRTFIKEKMKNYSKNRFEVIHASIR